MSSVGAMVVWRGSQQFQGCHGTRNTNEQTQDTNIHTPSTLSLT